ncbi:transcriptional regulator, CarD family [Lachnospiraceae bacterium RM5]|nr:transcriptional regulator, CarD family [Lachnospiraceae bacterium RM5]
MFKVNDLVIYGSNGVCKIIAVGKLDGMSNDKQYYTLEPYYAKASKYFLPVDNDKVVLRKILSKDEANALIDDIKNIGVLWISDERKRELDYKEAIKKCDPVELVKIIKTIYHRKEERLAVGKKITAGDEKYFNIAENSLYGELACSLDIDKDEVKDYIISKVNE